MEFSFSLAEAAEELGADLLAVKRLLIRGKLPTVELPSGIRILRHKLAQFLETGTSDLRMLPETFRELLTEEEHREADSFRDRVAEILRSIPVDEKARAAAERKGQHSASVDVPLTPALLAEIRQKAKSPRFQEVGQLFVAKRIVIVFLGKEMNRAKTRRAVGQQNLAPPSLRELYDDQGVYAEVIQETAKTALEDAICENVSLPGAEFTFSYRLPCSHFASQATIARMLESIL